VLSIAKDQFSTWIFSTLPYLLKAFAKLKQLARLQKEIVVFICGALALKSLFTLASNNTYLSPVRKKFNVCI
jgi:hypothetical protein